MTTFTPKENVESYMMAVIGSIHVTADSCDVLQNIEVPFVQNLVYGWLINFWMENWREQLARAGVDEATLDNFSIIRDNGYEVIMIDCDVEAIDLLKELQ